jgi:hypothetical protein
MSVWLTLPQQRRHTVTYNISVEIVHLLLEFRRLDVWVWHANNYHTAAQIVTEVKAFTQFSTCQNSFSFIHTSSVFLMISGSEGMVDTAFTQCIPVIMNKEHVTNTPHIPKLDVPETWIR